jgi:hypothetical protein
MTRDNVDHTVKTNVDAFDPQPRGLAVEETASYLYIYVSEGKDKTT